MFRDMQSRPPFPYGDMLAVPLTEVSAPAFFPYNLIKRLMYPETTRAG